MTLDHFTQAWIVVFGGVAMWLMAGSTRRSRYCGAWLGLINQPAWYIQMVLHGQWIMAPIYLVYTFAWIRGVLNNRSKIGSHAESAESAERAS